MLSAKATGSLERYHESLNAVANNGTAPVGSNYRQPTSERLEDHRRECFGQCRQHENVCAQKFPMHLGARDLTEVVRSIEDLHPIDARRMRPDNTKVACDTASLQQARRLGQVMVTLSQANRPDCQNPACHGPRPIIQPRRVNAIRKENGLLGVCPESNRRFLDGRRRA